MESVIRQIDKASQHWYTTVATGEQYNQRTFILLLPDSIASDHLDLSFLRKRGSSTSREVLTAIKRTAK